MIVEGLYYTKDHEWARVDGHTATVGITDYAQEMLGEITFVELPSVGRQCSAHDELAVVESTKAAGEVYAPLAGQVVEVNEELQSRPELLNQSCYEDGWICKLTVSDKASLSSLMSAAQYEEYLKQV